jgi:hypothetical protein
MIIRVVGLGAKDHSADEGQQQFSSQALDL